MGCVQSYAASLRRKKESRILESAAKTKSDALSKQLGAEGREAREERVMLAFECGDSGKSIVLDQMKHMEGNTYSDAERDAFRKLIASNVVYYTRLILEALPQLGLTLPLHLKAAAITLQSLPRVNHIIAEGIDQALRLLCDDPIFKEASMRGREFGLDHNASYYLNSFERILRPDYQPTREDITQCRVGLTGIMEMTFSARQFRYKVCDMGPGVGNPVAKKYIRGFTGVQAVFFFINLCDYDRYDHEGLMRPSRMDDAMSIFGSICDSIWFRDSDVIVFFTHKDEFDRKLATSPLGDHFRDYSGGNDPQEASQHILNWFRKLDGYKDVRRQMLTYFVSAKDPPEKLNAFLVDYFTPRWVMP